MSIQYVSDVSWRQNNKPIFTEPAIKCQGESCFTTDISMKITINAFGAFYITITCLKKLVSEEKGISKQNHIMAAGFIGEQEITMVIIGTSLVVQGLRI